MKGLEITAMSSFAITFILPRPKVDACKVLRKSFAIFAFNRISVKEMNIIVPISFKNRFEPHRRQPEQGKNKDIFDYFLGVISSS